ncbi:MAG: hypothetical protein ACHQQQ_09215 [Bacteroidota bacterium]
MKGHIGEIIEIYILGGTTMGLIRIKGELIDVPLMLLMDAKKGDRIIVGSGIALSLAASEKIIKN